MNQNIHLFYGENQLNLKKELQLWRQSFLNKYPDSTNFSEFKNPTKELITILSDLQTPPFLDDKRLVFVFNLYQQLEPKEYAKFMKQLPKIADTSIVVFIEETKIPKNAKIITDLKKIGQVREFAVSNKELTATFNQIMAAHKKKISPNLLQELIIKLEQNPAKLEQEAIKLALFCGNEEITETEIQQIVKFSSHISVFELIDNISAKKTKLALKNFNSLIDAGEEPTKVFYLIARQIRILIQLISLKQAGKSESEIAKSTGLHPFVVKKSLPQLRNFTVAKLTQILNQLLQIDHNLKAGGIKYTKQNPTEMLVAIEKIIIELCQ
jgi:DNA polymerase-3 subunit delta